MTDPLTLLREYNVNKKEIIERDDQIIFGEFSWPKNAKTNCQIWGFGKDGKTKEHYTLESLLYILKNISLAHPVYARQAADEKMIAVKRPDRKKLLAYLNGKSTSCPAIDESAPIELPTQVKRPAAHDEPDTTTKKPHFDDFHVREQIEDAVKETSVAIDSIKSLTEVMSVEKIAAIKAKRLAKKRIIGTDQ
ncbi:PREDICTED: parafibromin-like [Nicrophorus vespilloides]|uniref:Parafibromin-like n=1 Tax=Nicrophorus vespilloides TaxID=110193 RepID=A0ABM1M8U3_NICVS|nr:PREDICTED: parafibromin-like [Nicrophorus vespilloides]